METDSYTTKTVLRGLKSGFMPDVCAAKKHHALVHLRCAGDTMESPAHSHSERNLGKNGQLLRKLQTF